MFRATYHLRLCHDFIGCCRRLNWVALGYRAEPSKNLTQTINISRSIFSCFRMHTIGAEDRFVFRIAILPWPPHIYTERHWLTNSRAQDGDENGHFCFLLRQTFGCECERLSAHSQIDWWVICATLDENTFYLIVATFHFVLGRCWRGSGRW